VSGWEEPPRRRDRSRSRTASRSCRGYAARSGRRGRGGAPVEESRALDRAAVSAAERSSRGLDRRQLMCTIGPHRGGPDDASLPVWSRQPPTWRRGFSRCRRAPRSPSTRWPRSGSPEGYAGIVAGQTDLKSARNRSRVTAAAEPDADLRFGEGQENATLSAFKDNPHKTIQAFFRQRPRDRPGRRQRDGDDVKEIVGLAGQRLRWPVATYIPLKEDAAGSKYGNERHPVHPAVRCTAPRRSAAAERP